MLMLMLMLLLLLMMSIAFITSGPTTVAICFPLQPVFSALLGTLVLGSPLYLGNVVGGILVAIGLITVEMGRLGAGAGAGAGAGPAK